MVTYGPWSEPVEYTETWTLGVNPTSGLFTLLGSVIDPVPEKMDGTPLTYSEWRALGGLQPRSFYALDQWGFDSSLNGDLDDGRYGTDAISQDAWASLYVYDDDRNPSEYNDSSNPGEGGVGQPRIEYSSTNQTEIGTFGYMQHQENWRVTSVQFVPEFVIRNYPSGITEAALGIPTHSEDVWYEVDPTRNTRALYSEPVSLSVEASVADARWLMFVVDTDTPAVDWQVSFSDSSDTLLVDSMRNFGLSAPDYAFDYDVAPVDEWKHTAGGGTAYSPGRARMPHLGFAWNREWPGWFWPHDPFVHPASPAVTFTYTWRAAPWRFVYPETVTETVPYRRIFPRDDGLSGGARRNYPPSRAIQSGNRNGGGYL